MIALASLMVSSASLALALWSLKISRDADFNSRALDLELARLRGILREEIRAEQEAQAKADLAMPYSNPFRRRPPVSEPREQADA